MNNTELEKLYSSILVIIPARNEAESLRALLKSLLSTGLKVLLVDDASTDNTPEIAQSLGIQFCRHESCKGKGAALSTGFEWALKNTDATWIAVMDGDGQHLIQDLDKLIQESRFFNKALIVGERPFHNPMPLSRQITNRLMTAIVNILTKLQIKDSQCGLRLIPRDLLSTYTFKTERFEIETEMLFAAAALNFPIHRVPISTHYIPGRVSRIRPFGDTIRWLKFIAQNYKMLSN